WASAVPAMLAPEMRTVVTMPPSRSYVSWRNRRKKQRDLQIRCPTAVVQCRLHSGSGVLSVLVQNRKDDTVPEPPYARIAAELSRRITDRELAVGDKVPS